MPIKFRCQHCKQLLGIAHTKAGKLVDCPTCGRTLRVPNLDGTIDPEPALGMDLADDQLRKALDELGQIGKVENQPVPSPNAAGQQTEVSNSPAVNQAERSEPPKAASVDAAGANILGANILGANDLEAEILGARPAKRSPSWTDGEAQRVVAHNNFPNDEFLASSKAGVAVPPQVSPADEKPVATSVPANEHAPDFVSGNAKGAVIALEPRESMVVIDPPPIPQGGPPESKSPATSNPQAAKALDEEILAGLAQSGARAVPQANAAPVNPRQGSGKPGTARVSRGPAVLTGVICFIVGIVLGFGVAKWKSPPKSGSELRAAASGNHAVGEVSADGLKLRGRLLYTDPQGRLQPDSGARLLLIPIVASRKEKLPGVGFRLTDGQTNREIAAKALAEFGGTTAKADAEGKFSLDVPQEGDFQLIALSRFQGRNPDTSWSKRTESVLRTLFDRPEQLVEKRAFHVETIQHPGLDAGNGIVIWNHVFEWE